MHVILVTQYFPPETGGPQNRLAAIATGLRRQGHHVHVIAPKPSYPKGVVFEGFQKGFFRKSEYQGVPVTHVWVCTDKGKTTWRRILFYTSFMISAIVAAVQIRGQADVVMASSPPLTLGFSGWIISRLKRARYVFDVRDLWPDVAVALGKLNEGGALRVAKRMEAFIYRKSDGITTVTKAFREDIVARSHGEKPVAMIANGTVPSTFDVREPRDSLREELALPKGFLVTYSGNIGLAQGLWHVLDAGEILRSEGNDVTILLLGDGPVRKDIEQEVRKRKLHNVVLRARVDLEQAARYMAASDALLVSLARDPIYKKFIPSKLFDAMAAGRPVLLGVDGEARAILSEADAGVFYDPENAKSLVKGITVLQGEGAREGKGVRGRAFVRKRFSRHQQVRELSAFLEALADESGERRAMNTATRAIRAVERQL